jgi:hypothetical protein
MKKSALLPGILLLLLLQLPAYGQKVDTRINPDAVPRGISWHDWEQMNKRWQPFSTRVFIQKKDGTTLEGQLTWMSDSQMMVQKDFLLPNGVMDPANYEQVRISQITSMKVRIGGQPFTGLINGLLIGAIPGAVTGAILAQGWTVIPAIVMGAITAGGGGALGARIQKAGRKQELVIEAEELSGRTFKRIKKSALFPETAPTLGKGSPEANLPGFESMLNESRTLRRAFPVRPFSISVSSTLMTNSIRKRLQTRYLSPLFGPADPYYETRIGLQADVTRKIGKRFEAGALLQLFPGNISSSFFQKYLPEWDVSYNYNHHFTQTTFGIYGGWLLQPADRYWASRLELSLQAGAVLSDVYEHFYFQWTRISDYQVKGETFIQKHNLVPGAMMRLKASWYLIPGISIDAGMEGFLIKRIWFEQRDVLPQTAYEPLYIGRHRLNFSNLQGSLGLSIHL